MLSPELWIALITLATLEIVLGVDNLVFISIAVGRLPPERRSIARKVGLGFACVTRIALLLVLAHLARMDDKTTALFTAFGHVISVRDLIMAGGGLFLIVKGIMEIIDAIKPSEKTAEVASTAAGVAWVIAQIAVIDIVFSLDSVITAVGMVTNIPVMVAAIILAVGVMIFASDPVGNFIDNNPAVRMLALAFIVLIGFVLVGEGIDLHVKKGYIYGAMLFSAIVEVLNLLAAKNAAKSPPPQT